LVLTERLCAFWGGMRKDLELLRVLQSGEEGTADLVAKYGDTLVRVRLWYDAKNHVELKTAELVTLRKPWQPRRLREKILEPRSPRR
jgi:hypothetical protein